MATFPDDASYSTGGVTYTMTNKKPDRGFNVNRVLNSSIFTAQSGHEARRLITRRAKRTIPLNFTNVIGPYKQAIENFYNSRSGDFESFEFDLTYVGLSGTIIVRFSGPLNIQEVLTSQDEINDFYNVSFTLEETFS